MLRNLLVGGPLFAIVLVCLPIDKQARGEEQKDHQAARLARSEKKLIDLTNAERKKAGVPLFTVNDHLMRFARAYARTMADRKVLSHQVGGGFLQRTRKAGITFAPAGENIACGQEDAPSALDAWMSSRGHRANLLNGKFTQIGVGLAYDEDNTPYWCQVFAAAKEAAEE